MLNSVVSEKVEGLWIRFFHTEGHLGVILEKKKNYSLYLCIRRVLQLYEIQGGLVVVIQIFYKNTWLRVGRESVVYSLLLIIIYMKIWEEASFFEVYWRKVSIGSKPAAVRE